MNKSYNYIFVDESGDPGKLFKINSGGKRVATGASLYYILSAVCINSRQLFLLENMVMEIKNKFGYKKEIKSTDVSLSLYKALLNIINKLDIKFIIVSLIRKSIKGNLRRLVEKTIMFLMNIIW
ncbi:MAG: hypothetical protein CMI55_03255 [Parcubacteria group bacterium]|jgi:hypothetical protein|nr:hypothetical protein [Parcubacteria group bacterium]|tara:strand:- start:11436 stop:11807 length:372 start_codon:yes stop_codon:yes gene_type:complete